MRNYLLWCIAVFLVSCGPPAQDPGILEGSVTVYGKIINPLGNKVRITYEKFLFLSEESVADSAILDKDGNFTMTFPWKKAGEAWFINGEAGFMMYLSPGDSLNIGLDAKNLEEESVVKFAGRGSEINTFVNYMLLNLSSGERNRKFEDTLRNKQLRYFNEYFSKIPNKTPSVLAFMDYEEAEINYQWATAQAFYARGGWDTTSIPLPDNFRNSIPQAPIQNPKAINSPAYLRFVNDYVIDSAWKLRKQDTTQKIEDVKWKFIEDNFSGDLEDMLLAWLVSEMLRDYSWDIEKISKFLFRYNEYAHNQEYGQYLNEVKENGLKLSPGYPAPDFKCLDSEGRPFSLEKLKGKVIYLCFVNTHITSSNPDYEFDQGLALKFENMMLNKNIVFIYIEVLSWGAVPDSKVKSKRNTSVINLVLSDTNGPGVAKRYCYADLSRYFLIDKEGEIVNNNAKQPGRGNLNEIESLLK